MKNTKTITIHYEESDEKVVTLAYAPVESTWVNCHELFQKFPNGCLVERKHKFLQTQFILDNTESCKLVVFDVKKGFVTVKSHSHIGDAPFSFLISDHYVVLLPTESTLDLEGILSMTILSHSQANKQSSKQEDSTPEYHFGGREVSEEQMEQETEQARHNMDILLKKGLPK